MSTFTHESHDCPFACPFARRISAVDTASLLIETDAITFAEHGEVGQNEVHWQLRDPRAPPVDERASIIGVVPPEV